MSVDLSKEGFERIKKDWEELSDEEKQKIASFDITAIEPHKRREYARRYLELAKDKFPGNLKITAAGKLDTFLSYAPRQTIDLYGQYLLADGYTLSREAARHTTAFAQKDAGRVRDFYKKFVQQSTIDVQTHWKKVQYLGETLQQFPRKFAPVLETALNTHLSTRNAETSRDGVADYAACLPALFYTRPKTVNRCVEKMLKAVRDRYGHLADYHCYLPIRQILNPAAKWMAQSKSSFERHIDMLGEIAHKGGYSGRPEARTILSDMLKGKYDDPNLKFKVSDALKEYVRQNLDKKLWACELWQDNQHTFAGPKPTGAISGFSALSRGHAREVISDTDGPAPPGL